MYVDLIANLSKYVAMEIVNSTAKKSRIEKVKIQYDFLPNYCKKCMLLGHNEQECRILHPELKQMHEEDDN